MKSALKYSLVCALWLAVSPAAQAAENVIAGRLVTQADQAPIAEGYVSLLNAENRQAVSAGASGSDGRFALSGLSAGRYLLQASAPGYAPLESPVLIGDKNSSYNLGDLPLVREATEEVLISATQANSLDRRVYELGDSATQSTGSMLDALRNLPGVAVDPEGKLLLRGSDKVLILIDGKPSGITGFGDQRGLDSLPAANAQRIEVINNPSARYDAAGMAGVINIVYRQETAQGWSGDLTTTARVGQLTRQRADLPTEMGSISLNPKAGLGGTLNYNAERLRGQLQLEYLNLKGLPNNEYHTRSYDTGLTIVSQVPENRRQYRYIVKPAVDWTLPSGNLLTFAASHDYELHVDRAQVPFINTGTGQLTRYWFWREREFTAYTNASVAHKWLFAAPGHTLNLRLEYNRVLEDEAYFLNEISPVRTGTDNTHIVADESALPLSLDYVRPMRFGRIESGFKYQRRWIPVTYDVERGVQSIVYPGLGDWSDWDEDIYAAYLNLVRESERLDIEAGLRAEHTAVAYTIPPENIYYPGSDSYDYFELYPNLKFTWPLTNGDRMLAAYNRRVDRPGEPQLRIFAKYDDPENLKVGNPYLRPQFTDVFEVAYQHDWARGSASLSAYLRRIDDAFLRVYAIDNSDPNYAIVNKIFHNVGTSRQSGMELIFNHRLNDAWSLSGSVNGFRNRVNAYRSLLYFPTTRPLDIPASSATSWDLKLGSQARLPGNAQLQLNYLHYAARNVSQGRELARSSLDLAYKRPIMDGKAEFALSITDLFNNFGYRHEARGNGFVSLYENLYETQVLSAAIKLRF